MKEKSKLELIEEWFEEGFITEYDYKNMVEEEKNKEKGVLKND